MKRRSWSTISKVIPQLWMLLLCLGIIYMIGMITLSIEPRTGENQSQCQSDEKLSEELIKLQKYWVIEIEGMKFEAQRQLYEKQQLEKRQDYILNREIELRNCSTKEKAERERQRLEEIANRKTHIAKYVEEKCGNWITPYTLHHNLILAENFAPRYVFYTCTGTCSVAEQFIGVANALALAVQSKRAFCIVNNNGSQSIHNFFDKKSTSWKCNREEPKNGSLTLEKSIVSISPNTPSERQSFLDSMQNTTEVPLLHIQDNNIGILEGISTSKVWKEMKLLRGIELGCMLHSIMNPSMAIMKMINDTMSTINEDHVFSVGIYAPLATLGETPIDRMLECAQQITKYMAKQNDTIRWILITEDLPTIRTATHLNPTNIIIPPLNNITSPIEEAATITILSACHYRVFGRSLVGRVAGLMSMRFNSNLYLPMIGEGECTPDNAVTARNLEVSNI